jgi:3-isopropylmalate/(R)-2-methylmalate dehydratase small subunit
MKLKPFSSHAGLVLPLDISNVDTDLIIPKQYLKSIKKVGFGPYLFDELRYLDSAEYGDDCSKRKLNTNFILNKEEYKGSSVLLARENFGCGSSREHAPWAMLDYGFRVIIAPSFADIFFSNSVKNGLLPIVLDTEIIEQLFVVARKNQFFQLNVDLPSQLITNAEFNFKEQFEIAEDIKNYLIAGMDEISMTLQYKEDIKNYENQRLKEKPWIAEDPQEILK